MSNVEVPIPDPPQPEPEKPVVDGGTDLSEKARRRIASLSESFSTELRRCATERAKEEGLDTISEIHVNQALRIVCRTRLLEGKNETSRNVFGFISALMIGSALAIPDLGDELKWTTWRPSVYICFLVVGIVLWAIAFLFALGPAAPKWMKYIAIGIDRHFNDNGG